MKKITFLLFILTITSSNFFVQKGMFTWNPDAGLIPSYTDGAEVIVSSNQDEAWKILDGNYETAWQSGAPLPDGFLNNENQNILLGSKGFSANQNTSVEHGTDGNLNTHITVNGLPNSFEVKLYSPLGGASDGSIFIKCQAKTTVQIFAITKTGKPQLLGDYHPNENFLLKKLAVPKGMSIQSFTLQSEQDFLLFEIAALENPITEFAIFDFVKTQPVGMIKTRHWAGEQAAYTTKIYLSQNMHDWQLVANLDPSAQYPVLTSLPKEIPARFLKVEYELREKDWNKVFLWEVKAYDKYGPYGAPPPAHVGAVSLRDMLGVNGYWSWGTDVCSADLPKGEGPWRYAPIASHGRNYHDLTWDLETPNQSVDFSKMKTEGTPAKEWLRWGREYQTWVNAGMNIQATLQFYRFKPSQWNEPKKQGFEYANAFAKHFGLANGNGLVCTIEAGNEPWKYPAEIYREILLGMAKGAKSADSYMEVFPCALQAADPSAEHTDVFKNYIGARVTPEAAQFLDGINVHAYSYVTGKNGERRAVHPEHPESTFWEILNAIRWRNENMPGKKIYLSEWGWDADGGGEDCTHEECVTETEATAYAVRAALISSRLGIDRATWFFYANADQPSSLYSRSGLTGSKSKGFEKKRVFHAFEALIGQAGGSYFDKVIREDETAWIYQFADFRGRPTHIVAWRPINGDESATKDVILKTSQEISKVVVLDGLQPNGKTLELPKKIKEGYDVRIQSIPTLFVLK